jgi:hypothetical protein
VARRGVLAVAVLAAAVLAAAVLAAAVLLLAARRGGGRGARRRIGPS